MSMTIQSVSPPALQSPSLGATTVDSPRQTAWPAAPMPDSGASAEVSISDTSRVQSEKEVALSVGQRARQTDATFEKALVLLDAMKEKLSTITKQFPPFATDSQERRRYLEEFSSLRAQIEALTFPREPETAGTWSTLTFPPEHVDLGIPQLNPHSAPDSSIQAAQTQLDTVIADVAGQRSALYDSVQGVVSDAGSMDQALLLSRQPY